MIQKVQDKNIQPWIVNNITTKEQKGNKSHIGYHKNLWKSLETWNIGENYEGAFQKQLCRRYKLKRPIIKHNHPKHWRFGKTNKAFTWKRLSKTLKFHENYLNSGD